MTEPISTDGEWRFDDLRRCPSTAPASGPPGAATPRGLIDPSRSIMTSTGSRWRCCGRRPRPRHRVWPDRTSHGWPSDAWPALYPQVLDAGILVLCGPSWLGDNSSVTKRVIERLYACSSVLYSLQHLGYTIPPPADAGWIGEAGPGPSYLDPARAAPPTTSPTATPPSRPGTSCTWQPCSSGPAASRPMATNARSGTPAAASTTTTPNTAEALAPYDRAGSTRAPLSTRTGADTTALQVVSAVGPRRYFVLRREGRLAPVPIHVNALGIGSVV